MNECMIKWYIKILYINYYKYKKTKKKKKKNFLYFFIIACFFDNYLIIYNFVRKIFKK